MTLNISLSPSIEARLRQRAQAEGKDMVVLAHEIIEEGLASKSAGTQTPEPLGQGTAEWFASFNAWVASHPRRQFIADDSREAIYNDERDDGDRP